MRIYFIGTGGGAPSFRGLPSILVKREGISILLDCGEGTQWRLMQHSLGFSSIDAVFITHMHGDHVLGLPGLIETMGLLGRKKKLYLGGPRGMKEFLEYSFSLTHFSPQFDLEFVSSLELGGLLVTAFPTCHVIESYGYILTERDRVNLDAERLRAEGISDWRILKSLKEGQVVKYGERTLDPEEYLSKRRGAKVVYTGDTAPCDYVLRAAEGADLLIHDSTFLDEPEAHQFGHSRAKDAALISQRTKVKALALFHISSRYADSAPLLYDARRFFSRTFVAEPLSFYDVKA